MLSSDYSLNINIILFRNKANRFHLLFSKLMNHIITRSPTQALLIYIKKYMWIQFQKEKKEWNSYSLQPQTLMNQVDKLTVSISTEYVSIFADNFFTAV